MTTTLYFFEKNNGFLAVVAISQNFHKMKTTAEELKNRFLQIQTRGM